MNPMRPSLPLGILQRLKSERQRGRNYQPTFLPGQVGVAWLGALLSVALLSGLSAGTGVPLIAAPLGASAVLLFGYSASPLAQPRNIVLGNVVGAGLAAGVTTWIGTGPYAIAFAVGLTILLCQLLRCLHPPAGGLAFLGVALRLPPSFVVLPVLVGSVLLVLLAVGFSRFVKGAQAYPHHWL